MERWLRPPTPQQQPLPAAAGSAASDDPSRCAAEVAVIPEGKRQRCSMLGIGGERKCLFTLRNNFGDVPAPNPPLFTAHPLREEQQRSLAWMLQQEGRTSGVRGGVLADRMGFGKTATTIGLISLGGPTLSNSEQLRLRPGYVSCKATLVLCPEHLVSQWEGEFRKFLPAKSLIVVAIPNIAAWTRLTGETIMRADVMIAAYSVQGTDSFKKRFGFGGTALERIQQLKQTVKNWQLDVPSQGLSSALLHKGPILQMFHFHRIVMDEFHEAEGWNYKSRTLYEGTSATHRWGLSGTPPIGDIGGVVDVAEILHYDAPSFVNSPQTEWRTNLCRRVPVPSQVVAQGFLDEYVRQNNSELVDTIQVIEHREIVAHTLAERFIYQQACADRGIFDLVGGYEGVSMHTRMLLLKRCSHFAIGGETGSADASVALLGDEKRQRIKDLEAQLSIELARAAYFLKNAASLQPTAQHPETAAFLKRCRTVHPSCSTLFSLRFDGNTYKLVQPIPEQEYCSDGLNANRVHTLRHAVARHCAHGCRADAFFSGLEMCTQACRPGRLEIVMHDALNNLTKMLDEANRSLQFYQRQLASMSEHGDRSCEICLDENIPLNELCILPCSHIFHTTCARDVIQMASAACPTCRSPVTVRDIKHFQLELNAASGATFEAKATLTPPALKAHGSKLNAVANVLQRIKREDPTAKAIVFVQWHDIEARIAAALEAHGIPYLWLEGHHSTTSEKDDGAVLQEFQTSKRSFVMLLSLQRAASGSNLTSANHVLFVHPMNAETVTTAVAFEKQAIARIRRIGQQHREVHVWRFVTKDTVEEHITHIHQVHA